MQLRLVRLFSPGRLRPEKPATSAGAKGKKPLSRSVNAIQDQSPKTQNQKNQNRFPPTPPQNGIRSQSLGEPLEPRCFLTVIGVAVAPASGLYLLLAIPVVHRFLALAQLSSGRR
jgi:hypothetical protein